VRWLRQRWSDLRSGLWLFPGLIVAGLIGLAFAAIAVDRALGETQVGFGGGPSAARDLLAAIAGSFVTVAGVTFSLTVVVLQLASSQYSPRILRGFLADRITQLTAGAFIGVFAYALVVLRSVRNEPEPFVPSLGVSLGIVLALAALVLLLVFIDHVAKLIQVSNLAARIGADTQAELERDRGDPSIASDGELAEERLRAWRARGAGLPVHVSRSGYLRRVDVADLVRCLGGRSARVALHVGTGDLVVPDEVAAEVWFDADAVAGTIADVTGDAVRAALNVANERDLAGDPGFGIRQLSDIAIRALSPGVNDPTTAVTCVAYVRSALVDAATLPPARRLFAADGVELVLAPRPLDREAEPLVEIARHATHDNRVAGVVNHAIAAVAAAARSSGRGEEAARIEAAHRAASAPR
jgi:uncharacterized membrane protein